MIGLILILFALSLPAFSGMLRNRRIEAGRGSVEAAFLQARGLAISRRAAQSIEADLEKGELRTRASAAADPDFTARFEPPLRLGRIGAAGTISWTAFPDGTFEAVAPPDASSSAFDSDPAQHHDLFLSQDGSDSKICFDVVPVTGRIRAVRIPRSP